MSTLLILQVSFIIMAMASVVLVVLGYKGAEKQKMLIPYRDLEEVEAKLRSVREELAESREREAAARALIDEAKQKEAQLRQNEQALQAIMSTLPEQQRQLDEIKQRLLQRKGELGEANEDYTRVQQELAKSKGEQEAVQHALVTQQAQLETCTNQLREQQTALVNTEQEGRAKLARLKAIREELARGQEERAALTTTNSELASRKAELTADIAGLEQAQKAATDRVAATQRELEREQQRIQSQLATLEEDARRRREELLQGVNETKALAEKQLAILQNQMAQIDKAWRESLTAWKSSQESSLSTWESTQKTSLEIWERDQKALQDQLREQWEALQEHINKAVDVINGTWDRMRPPESAREDEKLSALWEPVFLRSELDEAPGVPDERAQLDSAKHYLRELGLVYPDRVINAFHTCLKTADMSLLTVLAGISGTGKSVLPRRYAEAMGLHFLNVAVQPRWDSPQDLFGFYNYIESKYKATELARVLVQMEKYNTGKLPMERLESLNERMCLVLFDEMNLARVEYYFSEFLSKLEVRRGIADRNQAALRRPAEVDFDTGIMSEGEHPVRVFPAGNILFVGTMNEDETTQALSDKVIDRANVLRFGRPTKLARSEDQRDDAKPVRTALSFDAWQTWIADPRDALRQSDKEQISKWAHRINSALGDIKRPFGHRVNLAIEHYVANHPESGETRLKHAFADQLEQRIMPKLRGLDCHDGLVSRSLQSINEVLGELEDEPLSAAFEKARSEDLFLWQGVERSE